MLVPTPIMFVVLLTLVERLCETTRLATKRRFSRHFPDIRKLTAFHGITLAECEERCFYRKRCKGALYNRLATMCSLTDENVTSERLRKHKGYVFVDGFDNLRQENSKPVCSGCSSEQTCVARGEGYVCQITECGPPPSIYMEYWGNMFSVNNTLVVQWEGKNSSIICGEDGQWAAVATACLPGWTQFESSCYFRDKTLQTHSDAKSLCVELRPGAHLADLTTSSEAEFVRDWLMRVSDTTYNWDDGVWIGAERIDGTNNFVWSDGTPVTVSEQWSRGNPDNYMDNESCVSIRAVFEFKWNDDNCDKQFKSLCEYDLI